MSSKLRPSAVWTGWTPIFRAFSRRTPRPQKMENNVLETEAFSISRDLKAPRALVYEVQTNAKHLANWLSPEGFRTTHADMDFRVGGKYHYCLEGPGGA